MPVNLCLASGPVNRAGPGAAPLWDGHGRAMLGPAVPAVPGDAERRPPPAMVAVPHRPEPGWLRWLPGVRTARSYRLEWLRHDVAAGLVLTAMLVPVGVAYAQASGVPGICGLYATIVPLLAYALFGPSRILVLGPDSALAAVILSVVLPLSAGDPQRAIAVAGGLAIVSGLVCVAAGLARLGFVTELLSKPIRYGYMNGIALTVLLSQCPKLFGFSAPAEGPLRQVKALGEGLLAGKANAVGTALGVGVLAAILVMQRRWPRLPAILIAVVAATVLVGAFDLDTRAGLAVLGPLPEGLPAFALPRLGAEDASAVLMGGLAVAVVAFADTSVLSRAYAARLRSPVDPDQEMVGLGLANLAAGFFQGIPISSSASRTPVAEAAGARTQLTGVVGALAIVVLLVAAPGLLRHVPATALAAVVISAAIGLVEVRDLLRILRIQPWEFWLSMACFAGVAVFGAVEGIGLAVVAAVLEFLWDGWRPHSAVLGRVQRLKGYHDVERYPNASRVPGLVLFRWDAPLFFANAEFFHDRVRAAIAAAAPPVRRIVVAAEPVTSVDVTAADALVELDEQLRAEDIDLCFAEMKDPVKDKLRRFELLGRFGPERFAPTVGEAVRVYLAAYPVEWVDWQDEDDEGDGAGREGNPGGAARPGRDLSAAGRNSGSGLKT